MNSNVSTLSSQERDRIIEEHLIGGLPVEEFRILAPPPPAGGSNP